MAWFDRSSAGNIVVKNPDEEIIAKMVEIGYALSAGVQGDEGEWYTADNLSGSEEFTERHDEPLKQTWWQRFRSR